MNFASESRSIKAVIQEVCQEQSPDAALKLLLRGVVSVTGAILGKLYLLSLKDSCFRVEFEEAREQGTLSFPTEISLHDLASGVTTDVVSRLLRSIGVGLTTAPKETVFGTLPPNLLVTPVIRNASLLGLMILERGGDNHFSDKDLQTVDTAVAIVIMLLEKRATLGLLQSIQIPVDFFLPFDQFLDQLLLIVIEATGMSLVALRELQPDKETLKCLSIFGFPETDKSVFNLAPLQKYPTFYRAIEEKTTQAEPDISKLHLESIRSQPHFRSVRSFVVTPILVGTSVFGTLSFAAECEYNYSPLELAGFETIANSIGIAITNRRNAERANEIIVENARVAMSFTAIEVAQSARHEAKGSIDNAQLGLGLLKRSISSGRQDREGNKVLVEKIVDSLSNVSKAIDKIRLASQIPQMKMEKVSIRELWQEAIARISGRIDTENVHTEIVGSAEIDAYPEALHLAFLNLLLNSLDAFHEGGKKSSRKITVNVDSRSDDAQEVKIRYYDNAGGIALGGLKLPPSIPRSHNPRDLIFERGVTSKAKGSGYGLYLVRRILDDHKGSIELVDYRGGVTFDIFLPKHQTIAAQTART